MDFLKSYFFKNEPLIIWTFLKHFFVSNFDETNVKKIFNWSEVHPYRNKFLKNSYFSLFTQRKLCYSATTFFLCSRGWRATNFVHRGIRRRDVGTYGPMIPHKFCLIRNKGKKDQMDFFYYWPSKITYIPTPLSCALKK
jgi:hypothetical protein